MPVFYFVIMQLVFVQNFIYEKSTISDQNCSCCSIFIDKASMLVLVWHMFVQNLS